MRPNFSDSILIFSLSLALTACGAPARRGGGGGGGGGAAGGGVQGGGEAGGAQGDGAALVGGGRTPRTRKVKGLDMQGQLRGGVEDC